MWGGVNVTRCSELESEDEQHMSYVILATENFQNRKL